MSSRCRTNAAMLVAALTAWSAGIDSAAGDPAIRVGPRGGLELRDGADAVVGLDLRMSLLNSIGLQRSYTLATATTALAQMTADTRDQRLPA